ncbi:MAG: CRISPR-associated endonuclease Cas3'', partial [Elusimicrobiota bacterium]
MDKYIKYWGKAKQSEKGEWACHLLPYHCLDVAAVGRIIMGASPQLQRMAKLLNISDKKLFDWLTFLFAVHDIGKFSNGFQALNPELCKLLHSETIRANYQEKHWSIGYRFLTDKAINEKIFPGANINLLKYWYSATTGHHGRPPQLNINPQPMQFQFPPDVEDTTNFIMELKKIFSVNAPPFNNEVDYYKVLPRVSWLVSGTTMLSDWVGSNPEWFPFLTKDIPLKEYFEKIALKQAEIAVNESGLLPIPAVSLAKDINKLFPEIKNLTNLQKTA